MALSHPTRVQILQILGNQVASPAIMARLLDLPLGTVSYHTKVLLEADCLALVRSGVRRGAVEHFYRAKPHTALGSREWQKVPPALRTDLTAAALDGFCLEVVRSLEAETFKGQEGAFLIWHPFLVDKNGWDKIRSILKSAEEKVRAVAQRCEARLDDPAVAIPVVVGLSAFGNGEADEESP